MPAVSDQHHCAGIFFPARLHLEVRGRGRSHLRHGEKIAPRPPRPFGFRMGLFHHLRIQPHPGQLDETALVRIPEVDLPASSRADHCQGALKVGGNSQLQCKDVHRPHRQDAQRTPRRIDSVKHFVDCPVTAGRNDRPETHGNRLPGPALPIPRIFRQQDFCLRGQLAHAIDGFARLIALGGGVQDDTPRVAG